MINRYRPGSNLNKLFETMRDGLVHDTLALSFMLFKMSNENLRTRVASALRTIRRDSNGADIIYVPHANRYYMIPTKGYRYVDV